MCLEPRYTLSAARGWAGCSSRGDQPGIQLNRQRHELAVVRGAVALPDELEYGQRFDFKRQAFEQALSLNLKVCMPDRR